MLLSDDNFSKIANGDMGNFVHFWGHYGKLNIMATFQ